MTRKQARFAYNCKYFSSMRYGLPSCSLTKSTIDHIQQQPVEHFLSKMGYENKFPRAIVFAPPEYGGLNLPHLYSEMMVLKLETLISNIRSNIDLGKAILININLLQLISGIEKPIFNTPRELKYIDNNWLLHLRSFLIEINGFINIKSAWHQEPQRQHDLLLMESFIQRGFSIKELRLINLWRSFFQVNTLADICEPAENSKIQNCFLVLPKGNIVMKKNRSKLNWPYQPEPGDKGFKLWCKAIKESFQLDITARIIKYNIGLWLV